MISSSRSPLSVFFFFLFLILSLKWRREPGNCGSSGGGNNGSSAGIRRKKKGKNQKRGNAVSGEKILPFFSPAADHGRGCCGAGIPTESWKNAGGRACRNVRHSGIRSRKPVPSRSHQRLREDFLPPADALQRFFDEAFPSGISGKAYADAGR